jgi:hypothetical protein
MTLRFGIMCRGTSFEYWEASAIRKLLALGFVRPALLIIEPPQANRPRSSIIHKVRTLFTSPLALWTLYTRLFVEKRLNARAQVDLTAELDGVPRMECKVVRKGRYSEYFSEEDVAAIRDQDLDFILRFGFNIIRGEVLRSARYGVWSFHHDDLFVYRGGPPCFWEIYEGASRTGIVLQRLTDKLDGGVMLKQGHFATKRSYASNLDTGLMLGVDWPSEVCADIASGRAGYIDADPVNTTAPIYTRPVNGEMLGYLWRKGR